MILLDFFGRHCRYCRIVGVGGVDAAGVVGVVGVEDGVGGVLVDPIEHHFVQEMDAVENLRPKGYTKVD